jgi:hypothetical protein
MNILDENVPDRERHKLRRYRLPFRQIGRELGRTSMSDRDIITMLHSLDRPTLFTLDVDFFKRRFVHAGYCLVHLNVWNTQVANYIRRVLKHPQLSARSKRMGCVLSASPQGLIGWRAQRQDAIHLRWATR